MGFWSWIWELITTGDGKIDKEIKEEEKITKELEKEESNEEKLQKIDEKYGLEEKFLADKSIKVLNKILDESTPDIQKIVLSMIHQEGVIRNNDFSYKNVSASNQERLTQQDTAITEKLLKNLDEVEDYFTRADNSKVLKWIKEVRHIYKEELNIEKKELSNEKQEEKVEEKKKSNIVKLQHTDQKEDSFKKDVA